jgi:hypothetical protein
VAVEVGWGGVWLSRSAGEACGCRGRLGRRVAVEVGWGGVWLSGGI